MKRIYIIILITIQFSLIAQNTITGKITDKNTQETLIGANIYIPEVSKGTASDINGKFTIENIPNGTFTINVSFLGYKNYIKKITFNNSDIKLDIELEQNAFVSEEIVISGGRVSSQHHNAIKIEAIPTKEISNSGNINLMKSISKIPGVDVISKGTGVATPVIRGLSTSNILVLNNGIRIEDYQFSENHPYLVDEFGVDDIEIIKGPASLLYGSDAIGGVINFVKEKPAKQNTTTADVNLRYFSNSNGLISNIGVKSTKKNIFWGIRLGEKSFEDYTDGSGVIVPNSRNTQYSAKAFVGLTKDFGIFRVFYDYNKMQLGLTIPPVIALTDGNSRTNEFWYQDLDNHLLYTKNTLFFNKLKTDINFSFQQNHRKLNSVETNPYFTVVDMSLTSMNYEIKNQYQFTERTSIVFGLQGMNQNNKNTPAPSIVIPDYTTNDFSVLALFEQDIIKYLHLQIGARFNYRNILVPEKNYEIANHSFDKIDKTYNNLSYSAGGTYHLTKNILLRANFASAYRTPNVAELTQDGVHGNRYEKGNTDLVSQQSYEGDFSGHYHAKHLVFDLALFYNNIDNYIYLAPTSDTISNGMKIYQYQQINAVLYGFETGVKILPTKWLNITETYNNTTGIDQNNMYLPFIPQNKINSSIKFLIKQKIFDNLSTEVSNTYAFAQNNISRFETSTPEYSVFNLSINADKKFEKYSISASITANNIFNEVYYDHLSTLKDMGYYNIGRNISIGLKFLF